MLKKVFFIFLLLIFLFPVYARAQESNAGFIPANIWYSKDPFQEGDKIKIYTLIFNSGDRELSGTVSFYDKSTLLGKKNFAVAAKGTKDIFVEWIATAGSHSIFAKIENAKFLISAGVYENARLKETETKESHRTVSKNGTSQNRIGKDDGSSSGDSYVEEFILKHTPSFLANFIIENINNLDTWRENMASYDSILSWPFKNRIVFYGLLVLVVFFMLRYIWQLFF